MESFTVKLFNTINASFSKLSAISFYVVFLLTDENLFEKLGVSGSGLLSTSPLIFSNGGSMPLFGLQESLDSMKGYNFLNQVQYPLIIRKLLLSDAVLLVIAAY